jgi:hypothetical protein
VLIQKERNDLVFDGHLGDPDQLPWLIAHALRSLMAEGDMTFPWRHRKFTMAR